MLIRQPAMPSVLKPVFLSLAVSLITLTVYHHFILRPDETVAVDFRRLSEVKLGQLVERTTKGGTPISPHELQHFLDELHAAIADEAGARPVFASGAVLNVTQDLTPILASRLGLEINTANPLTLPGMAARVEQQLHETDKATENPSAKRNTTGAAPSVQHP